MKKMSTPNMRHKQGHKLFSCLLYINVSYTQLCYYFPILWYSRSTRFFAFIFLFFRYPNTQTQLLLLFIYSLVWQMYFLATSPFNSVVLLFLVYFIFFPLCDTSFLILLLSLLFFATKYTKYSSLFRICFSLLLICL